MTNAWFLGAQRGVPQREDDARATTEPVRTDGPAEETNPPNASGPDWNEFESDESGQLNGLPHRMLAPDTVASKQFRPWWSALATDNHNVIVDNQVATSGTAAQREAKGEQGHGTMQYAQSLEPIVREGSTLGADYFAAHEMDIQEGAGVYMAPATGITSRWGSQVDATQAGDASRAAYQASIYQSFLDG